MEDLKGFGAKFQGFQSSASGSTSSPFVSAKRAFPNSAYSRYKEVEVLLIRWEEDELEVEWELNELHKVFRDLYGFTTEQFLIPTQNSHRKLNHKALSFVEEHENEETLLVVYYGGHGVINKARQSTWSCKVDKSYATVEWSAIQTLFEMAKCDVLLLLDCCAGASAAPLTERPTNIKETIAACGFETWTPRPGVQSFTHTLIEVMKEWASQLPFSAAMLHSRMFEQEPDSAASFRAIPGSTLGSISETSQSNNLVSTEDRIQTLLGGSGLGCCELLSMVETVPALSEACERRGSLSQLLNALAAVCTGRLVGSAARASGNSVCGLCQILQPCAKGRDRRWSIDANPHYQAHGRGQGISSLDSGYNSSISRPASLVVSRQHRQTADGSAGPLASHVLAGKRRSKQSPAELLSPDRPTSVPVNTRPGPGQDFYSNSRRSNRLVVSIGEADLTSDKVGHTCVLWYGYDVQQSQPARRATPKPTWNQDFRFQVHDSPMCYHLRVSVWGVQMLELIGEVYIDLCELVLRGQLPELGAWQNLRYDGNTTGSLRIKLAYLDASEDEEQQTMAAKASATELQQRRKEWERQQSDVGQARIQQMDFQVW
ncbi:hypothetical protein F66182_9286 [Fusarium sp. NRRL 66182]|nr:hypothetical protein F66182_9286 [Fusarium sp. NRRL 66182]